MIIIQRIEQLTLPKVWGRSKIALAITQYRNVIEWAVDLHTIYIVNCVYFNKVG